MASTPRGSRVASCDHITVGKSLEEENVRDAPPKFEEGVKVTVDELNEISLGTSDEPRPIYIIALLLPSKEKSYVELLHEFKYVFAWTYKEIPGLDPKVDIHYIAVK